jgi:hypothetical protein
MDRLRPGWLITVVAVLLVVSAWLPWLTTSAGGGGRASAIGGAVGTIELPDRFGVGQLIVLLASVLAVLGAIVGEFVGARAGLGMLLIQYDQAMQIAPLFAQSPQRMRHLQPPPQHVHAFALTGQGLFRRPL